MKSIRREQNQETTRKEIKAFAWNQIATKGVNSVSLGAIARSMNLTTPALYRYFEKRDDLILDLKRDATLSLQSTVESAIDMLPNDDYSGRYVLLCLGFFQWSIANPEQHQLLFYSQTPTVNGELPLGEFITSSLQVFFDVISETVIHGKIIINQELTVNEAMKNRYSELKRFEENYSVEVIYLSMATFSFLRNITTLELSQKSAEADPANAFNFFLALLERFMKSIGFKDMNSDTLESICNLILADPA